MSVSKQRHIAVCPKTPLDYALSPHSHMFDGFALHYAVSPQRPIGSGLANFGGALALICAVIPLLEILGYPCNIAVSSQPTSLSGALHGTYKHQCECSRIQFGCQLLRLLDAARQQWKIGT